MLAALLLALQAQAPAPPDSITLAEALAAARTWRSQGVVATATVAEARGAVRTSGAIPNPSLSYSHSGAVPTNHVLVDQPFDWLARRRSDRAAAEAGFTRAEADSAETMVRLSHEVRLAFWRARAADLSLTLVAAQAASADTLARIAAARLEAGDISLLDQEQAAQEAARARQAVSAARERARLAGADLARAAGLASAPRPVDPLDAGLDTMPDTVVDVSGVPALRGAVADSEAASALARSASLSRLPVPSVQGGVEWGDPGQPGALAVIGLAIPIPLWQQGGGPLAEARARAVRSGALAREARLDLLRDLGQARIRLEETAARARLARDSLVPAAAVLRGRALRAYQAGETGILAVLDALRGEREVVLGAVADQLSYQEALADWYAVVGRSE